MMIRSISNSFLVIPILFLFCSSKSEAGLRVSVGPAWYFERTQEQVIRPHSSLNYQFGYQWDRYALDVELGELWQETGNKTLSLSWNRRDSMLWGKYFSKEFGEPSGRRYFAALGVGQTRSVVDARVEGDAKSLRGEGQFVGGTGLGVEYRLADTPFTISPFISLRYGNELDPRINYYGVVHFGLTF